MTEDKKTYPNPSQKARLLSLMEADEELRHGKFSAGFTKKMAESRWQNIARELNSIPGSKKDWKAWRKSWQDMKSKTKKKQSQIHRSHNLTGGGPAIAPLTDNETGILATISQSAVIGHQDSSESQVTFIDEIAGPSQYGQPASSAVPEVVVDVDEDDFILDVDDPLKIKEKENKKPNRTVAQRRLQQSLEVAASVNKILEEKNAIKKEFYEKYIEAMKAQTRALYLIANSLSNR